LLRLPHVVLYRYTQQPSSDGQSHLPSHAQTNEVQSDIENENKHHKLNSLTDMHCLCKLHNQSIRSQGKYNFLDIYDKKNGSMICD